MATPRLPTYQSAAAALEGKTGSGMALLGWTLARTILIAPPMMAFGVPAKQAWLGALLASGLISTLAVARLHGAAGRGPAGRMLYGHRGIRRRPMRLARR